MLVILKSDKSINILTKVKEKNNEKFLEIVNNKIDFHFLEIQDLGNVEKTLIFLCKKYEKFNILLIKNWRKIESIKNNNIIISNDFFINLLFELRKEMKKKIVYIGLKKYIYIK